MCVLESRSKNSKKVKVCHDVLNTDVSPAVPGDPREAGDPRRGNKKHGDSTVVRSPVSPDASR